MKSSKTVAALVFVVMAVAGCGDKVSLATVSGNKTISQANCEVNIRQHVQKAYPGKTVTTNCDQDTDITSQTPVGDGWATGHVTVDDVPMMDLTCPTFEKTGFCLTKIERDSKKAFIDRQSFVDAYIKESGPAITQFK